MSKSPLSPAAGKAWAILKRNGKRLHKARYGWVVEVAAAFYLGRLSVAGQAVHVSAAAVFTVLGVFALLVGAGVLIRTVRGK